MGLPEKRALKEFQDNRYPELKKKLEELAGFPVELEVDWESLAVDEYGHLYNDAFDKVYFQPVIAALQKITGDDMGKEAIKEGLKKIVMQNKSGNYSPDGLKFDGGVLMMDHQPTSNIEYVEDRAKRVFELFEKGL
jgi:hypothetical protein